tara:strand:+ start:357 stop:557 length:201 start_codon:yes stop_codon:yes gene_type:complete
MTKQEDNKLLPPTVEQCTELAKQFYTMNEVEEGDSIYGFFFSVIKELSERVQELENVIGMSDHASR